MVIQEFTAKFTLSHKTVSKKHLKINIVLFSLHHSDNLPFQLRRKQFLEMRIRMDLSSAGAICEHNQLIVSRLLQTHTL